MSWHYQVMKHTRGEEVWYGVHEYYELEDKAAWSVTPVLTADSVDELKQTLKMIEQDIYKHGVKDYE